jgi:antitoxin component YwqK of YwqJK toxin-antitoxin module
MDIAEAKNEFKNGHKQGRWIEYFDAEWNPTDESDAVFYRLIVYDKGNPKKGFKIHDFYISGQLQFEGYLDKTEPDAVHGDGITKWYHEDGSLATECNFLNGEKDGVEKVYHENGVLKYELYYSKGLVQGEYKEYYDNNNKACIGTFNDNAKNGLFIYYEEEESDLVIAKITYENGKKKRKKHYADGNLIEEIEYSSDEEIIKRKCFNEGEEINCQQPSSLKEIIEVFEESEKVLNLIIEYVEDEDQAVRYLTELNHINGKIGKSLNQQNDNSPEYNYLKGAANFMNEAITGLTEVIEGTRTDLTSTFLAFANYKAQIESAKALILGESFWDNIAEEEISYGIITGNGVYFRKTPSIENNNVITQFNKEAVVIILDKYSVSSSDNYICNKNTTFYPTNKSANIRLNQGQAVKLMSKNTEYAQYWKVSIVLKNGSSKIGYIKSYDLDSLDGGIWYKVKSREQIGWIFGDYVQIY